MKYPSWGRKQTSCHRLKFLCLKRGETYDLITIRVRRILVHVAATHNYLQGCGRSLKVNNLQKSWYQRRAFFKVANNTSAQSTTSSSTKLCISTSRENEFVQSSKVVAPSPHIFIKSRHHVAPNYSFQWNRCRAAPVPRNHHKPQQQAMHFPKSQQLQRNNKSQHHVAPNYSSQWNRCWAAPVPCNFHKPQQQAVHLQKSQHLQRNKKSQPSTAQPKSRKLQRTYKSREHTSRAPTYFQGCQHLFRSFYDENLRHHQRRLI